MAISQFVYRGTKFKSGWVQAFATVDGVPVDPDQMVFNLVSDAGETLTATWTGGADGSDPENLIWRTSVGVYWIWIDTGAFTGHALYWSWFGSPLDEGGTDETKTALKMTGQIAIKDSKDDSNPTLELGINAADPILVDSTGTVVDQGNTEVESPGQIWGA